MNDGNAAARARALRAGAIGNVVEWYDFALYGFFATAIAASFFPKSHPTSALLSTFAIFGVSFLLRPLGAIVFGHLGDRVGRRSALLVSVLLMSAGTVVMGLLPSYAQIGVAAPLLLVLCRLVQGFSAGGEFAGSTILVIEHTPPGRRGRYASLTGISVTLGTASGALVSMVMASTTTPEQLASWAWRVPFVAAAPLALVGLYLRLRVDESPVFTALQAEGHIESMPVVQALKVAKKPMLILIGLVMTQSVAYFVMSTFLVSYLVTTAGFSNADSLFVQLVLQLLLIVGSLLAGRAIDRIGRKPIAVASALCLGAWAIPAFALLKHSTVLESCLVVGVFGLAYSGISTTSILALAELFPARVRTSASALAYQLASAVFGGSAPYVATWLVGHGHFLAPGYYIAGLSAVSAVVAAIGIGNRPKANARLDPRTQVEAGWV
ncbi:MFS transporter [Kitasatospora azatica]|uniref:MFS transporter n=1 Tax=Kitasatospora azatica TaxID=58347 RepID=UPI0007C7C22F|nr:MFS transporter [Kitasatospora azatica]